MDTQLEFSYTFIALTILMIIIYYIYWFLFGRFELFKTLNIPGPNPTILLGNTYEINKNYPYKLHLYLDDNLKMYNGVFGFYYYGKPSYTASDPEILKEILVKQFDKFHDRYHYDDRPHPLNLTLGASRGKQWERIRRTLAPSFTTSKLKCLIALFNNATTTTISHLHEEIKQNISVDVNKTFTGFAMEAILLSVLGVHSETQSYTNKQLSQHIQRFFAGPPTWHSYLRFLPLSKYFIRYVPNQFFESMNEIFKLIYPVIAARRTEKWKSWDMLQLMLDSQEVTNQGLNDDEVFASCIIFLAAGVETTGKTLACLLYELAKRPNYQHQLLDEVQKHWPDITTFPTYETIQNMKFMDSLIKETLRLYPPGAISYRAILKDCKIKGVQFKAGCDFLLPIYSLHRDPALWHQPNDFIPERFSNGVQQAHELKYMPFGYGPRNCIGSRFSLLEMKILLTRLIKEFEFSVNEDTPKELDITINTLLAIPRHPICVAITKRNS